MYDRSGKVRLAEFWNDRRDVIDNFNTIPKVVLDATTATEDDTFWTNPGVDLEATMGQLFTVAGGGDGRGASTITQQLAKTYIGTQRTVDRKIREAILDRASTTEIRRIARRQGMLTLRDDGLIKVAKGVTTVEEVLRETAVAD